MTALGKFSRLRETGHQPQGAGDFVRRTVSERTTLPLVLTPAFSGVTRSLIGELRVSIEEDLRSYGAVLLRGWGVADQTEFREVVASLTDDVIEYLGSAARDAVGDRIYTTTAYPNELEIRLHNELSYDYRWPRKLFFYCDKPAETGGQTPLVDCRAVLANMPSEVLDPLVEHGVQYVRRYQYNRPWTKAYGTTDRSVVEHACQVAGRQYEWGDDGGLTTRETRPAVRRHPVTGEQVWFNFAHGFHTSRLTDSLRSELADPDARDREHVWPSDALYGDGTPISDEHIAVIHDVVEGLRQQFDWERGDVLIVDNMLCGHGRRPFTGIRRILLQVAENYSC